MRINEFMCQDVCFVKPDCNIYDAARIMNENHVGCIPICNDEKMSCNRDKFIFFYNP